MADVPPAYWLDVCSGRAAAQWFTESDGMEMAMLADRFPILILPEFPDTLDHLAALLAQQGKHSEAESCIRECYAIRRRVVGDAHPSTIKALNSLIELLRKQGKDAEAEAANRDVAESNGAIDETANSGLAAPESK